jgi:hypothetical protein
LRLITNGTLLDRKPEILGAVTGLVVSLDALRPDPTNAHSKPAALPKVLENLALAKERLGISRRSSVAGLVRRTRVRVCSAIGADGKDAQSDVAAESAILGARGYDHRETASRKAGDQWDAANDRDAG